MWSGVSGGKNVRFSENFGVLCFLETSALRFIFLPYYQRNRACTEVLNKKRVYGCRHFSFKKDIGQSFKIRLKNSIQF